MATTFTGSDALEEHRAACSKANDSGVSLGRECFPEEAWLTSDASCQNAKLEDLFRGGGYWMVSGRCADVLQSFDLGGGHVYPVRILKEDRETAFPGKYFCLNFGNIKRGLVAEHSVGLRHFNPGVWTTRGVLSDDDVACSADTLNGAEIWIDPQVYGVFFLSSRLAEALVVAQAVSGFGDLKRCRII